jgi:hypothetical protein
LDSPVLDWPPALAAGGYERRLLTSDWWEAVANRPHPTKPGQLDAEEGRSLACPGSR